MHLPPPKPENPILNLVFNIFLPIFILNKGGAYVGPFWALVIALAFPLSYGIYDKLRRKTVNTFSVIGLLNILLTGSLAVAGVTGGWFAVKEAVFPMILGIYVFWTAATDKPFIATVFLNPSLVRVDLLNEGVTARGTEATMKDLLRRSTRWLSVSFFISATLNFVLALRIFTPMPEGITDEMRSNLLNSQIAEMTKWSLPIILVPSMIILMALFYYLIKGLEKLSGHSLEKLMQVEAAKSSPPNSSASS